MRRIVSIEDKPLKEPDFSQATTTLDELIDKSREILRREILNLMIKSSSGSLDRDASMSLVSYVKLLGELKEKETEELRNLSEEHLEKLSKHDKL